MPFFYEEKTGHNKRTALRVPESGEHGIYPGILCDMITEE